MLAINRSCHEEIIPRSNHPDKPLQTHGAPPACNEPAARIVNLSGVYMNTRKIALKSRAALCLETSS